VFSFLRRASSKSLIALSGSLVALVAVGAVVASGSGGDAGTPPAKPLAQAIADSFAGPQLEGVSARINFTNKLLPSTGFGGQDPLMAGGSGRLWASNNGDVRIELQSETSGGDVQIVASGNTLWLYHAATNTVYKTTMAPDKKDKADKGAELPPTVAAVKRVLRQLGGDATVSGAIPDNVAGRPAYSTRIEPKSNGGLVGGADLTWDAANGAPLRVAVFARGQNDPVMAIEATDVSFGAVDPSVFDVSPPADAKIEELSPAAQSAKLKNGKKAYRRVTGLRAAQAAAPFTISAPAKLAGQKRSGVMLIGRGSKKSVVVRYGKGLGGITVIESLATKADGPAATAASKKVERDSIQIPTAKVGSAEAMALGTPLGAVVSFTRGGVRYVVIGSVTQQVALAAARGL
jgi:outer membrane lipoprotein-sorting protein